MVTHNGYYYYQGPAVNTRGVVSQKVKIFSYHSDDNLADLGEVTGFVQIGAISNFTVGESRNVEEIRGVGSGDRIMELVPGVTNAATIEVNRAAMWLENIFQVFGYKSGIDGVVRSLKHHRWPFDIRQELVFSEINSAPSVKDATIKSAEGIRDETSDGLKVLTTYYEGCWMRNYGLTFASTQAVVMENCSIICSDIIAGRSVEFDNPDFLNSNKTKAFRVRQTP